MSYLSLLPQGTRLKTVSTPFLATALGPDVCAPEHGGGGASVQCPWFRGAFPESAFKPLDDGQTECRKTASGIANPATLEPLAQGALADKAASMLMKVLYVARYARFDLLCAVARLAQNISKWTSECDFAVHRLMSYIHSTLQHRVVGYVGDDLSQVQVHVYADADFAGDPSSKRSTTGVHLNLRGPHMCFPVNGQSKRQECVSHSTPEAEIVAADWDLRREGIPTLDMGDPGRSWSKGCVPR